MRTGRWELLGAVEGLPELRAEDSSVILSWSQNGRLPNSLVTPRLPGKEWRFEEQRYPAENARSGS